MSLVYSRALTLLSAAMLAILLPVALAGADPSPTIEPKPHGSMRVAVNESSPYATVPVEIIDALVIERALPTDVIPQLPDVSFDD
jgi:hypothetical protein